MTFWWWVLVFGSIAVGALVIFGMLGLKIWRKARVLLVDLSRLSAVVGSLEAALGPAGRPPEPEWIPDPIAIGRHRSE